MKEDTEDKKTEDKKTEDKKTEDKNTDHKNTDHKNTEYKGITLFRFQLSQEIMEAIFEFSKIHQYDDQKTYKQKWQEWIQTDDISTMFADENVRLNLLGYKGETNDKIFKSSRYYYRNVQTLEKKKEMYQRKEYVGLSKECLRAMDDHINDNQNKQNNKPLSPSELFSSFCKMNNTILVFEINNLKKQDPETMLDANEVTTKLKKTYKNREYKSREVGKPRFPLRPHPFIQEVGK